MHYEAALILTFLLTVVASAVAAAVIIATNNFTNSIFALFCHFSTLTKMLPHEFIIYF
jgi:hypothetical protein